ncbi:MAG TPA: FHA domain-containing protein [Acidobacteriota bacterium]|nr:FHA domain-containing protein [Acidobacteriota bacterium]
MKAEPVIKPRVTGSRITNAVAAEMTAGAEPLLRSILVPSVFRIYLHPDDWERLYSILHELRVDVEEELDRTLARINRPVDSLLARCGLRKVNTYRRVKEYWQVDFYPNRDDSCPQGEFIIFSDFPEPPRADNLEGGETVRATRYGSKGGTGQEVTEPIPQPHKSEAAFAQIRFTDELGHRSYLMTRSEVHIGRGGLGRWIDLELRTEIPDVSREHAIIRRKSSSEAFEIKDLSRFGTTVNGVAVPPSKVVENGTEVDRDIWAPLPAPSRIVLAGKLELDFEPIRS